MYYINVFNFVIGLLIAHIFGVMPLVNSWDYNPYRVKFKVPCWALTTTVIFFIFGGWKTLHFSAQMFRTGINAKNIGK